MHKKSVCLIGFFSWLALVACSSGTVDPNALPMVGYIDEDSSSSSSFEIYSSSAPKGTGDFDISSSSAVVADLHDSVRVQVIGFETSVTEKYLIVVKEDLPATGHDAGQGVFKGDVLVYAEEKGAVASCDGDGKSYSSKFKLGQSNLVERSLTLKNYGSACESLFENFKKLCLLQNANDVLSGACDENGNLEAYCTYGDADANFDVYLSNFTAESKTNCDDGVRIDSFGVIK